MGWDRPGPVPLAKTALLLVGWESWIAELHTHKSNLPEEVETAPEQSRSSGSLHSQDSPVPCLLGPRLPKSPHSGQGRLPIEPGRRASRPSALRPGCSRKGKDLGMQKVLLSLSGPWTPEITFEVFQILLAQGRSESVQVCTTFCN